MILDATCGLKEMWFQKNDEQTIYLDIRKGKIEYPGIYEKYGYKNHIIKPTIQADNRYLPFKDNIFDMVLYDPPHFITNASKGSWGMRYGTLNPITWTIDMSKAIRELFRVLKQGGFFIFRWSEQYKAIKEALNLFPYRPLFGTHIGNPNHKTWWIVFRKD